MAYVVYVYEEGLPPNEAPVAECNAYGVVGMEGPEAASAEACEALAAEIRAQHPKATVMVVPFGEYKSTANQFVVKETGTFEGKPNTVQYFGPYATKADAEGAQRALAPGGGHEDMQDASFEIVEVTAAQLAGMTVEPIPE